MKCLICKGEVFCCTIPCVQCGEGFTPSTVTQKFCSSICRWRNSSPQNEIGKSSMFKKAVREKVKSRLGTMLSVKTTTKIILRNMGLMSTRQAGEHFKPVFGEILLCYKEVDKIFQEMGGEYWATADSTGKQYQFPR